MTLSKIAKNNLNVLIVWVIVNILVLIIAIIKGMAQSATHLLTFIGGQIFGLLLYKNIKGK